MRNLLLFLTGISLANGMTNCRCGWTNGAQSRIVGGGEAKINEFPWIAGLKGPEDYGPFCGGAILTRRHILTAAHCLHDHKFAPMVALVGEHDITKTDETSATQIIKVEKMIAHKDYDKEGNEERDIAVLYLEDDIVFSDKVGPICMPVEKLNLVRETVKVMGWGLTQMGGRHSEKLRFVDLEVRPLSQCEPAFPGAIPLKKGQTCHICTYTPNKDACQGDSGGPVVWKDMEIEAMTAVGIISFGGDCGDSPGINTEVFHYTDWIQDQIEATNKSYNTCHKI